MNGSRLWVIGFLAVLTNGSSLLGLGQASAGSLAKTIECNHTIARNIENAKALGLLVGTPPSKPRQRIEGPFAIDCSMLPRCNQVADLTTA
ncbi:hypothetical protein D3C80_1746100 [compost metagenome]